MNNIYELINKRRSVRTFSEKEVTKEELNKIQNYFKECTNPFNVNTEFVIFDNLEKNIKVPVITNGRYYILGKVKKEANNAVAFGYSFEKLVLFLESIGLSTTWIAGTMDRASFENELNLNSDEIMPSITPIGYEAKKMSMKEVLMRKGIGADKRIDFDKLFFYHSFDNSLNMDESNELYKAFNSVRLAPSAVNRQPWRLVKEGNTVHFFKKGNKGYVNKEGFDLQKVDIGIALCHFDLVLKELGYNTEIFKDETKKDIDDLEYIVSLKYSK